MKLFTAYNKKNFVCNLSNGDTIILHCYSTNTRNGFTHQCYCTDFPNITKSRISYFNRTWEAFEYESVLRSYIDKLPANIRAEVRDIILNGGAKKAKEAVEAFDAKLNAFRGNYEALSNNRKEFIKGLYSNGVNSITEAENVMQAAKIFNILDAICK
jgi:hypothetical protein